MLKELHPELIEVVGGQVMNTHTSFHRRLLSAENVHAAYDIALRTSTGYEPAAAEDKRLNRPLYERVALSAHGWPLASARLRDQLNSGIGECALDPAAFICHGFARPMEIKVSSTHAPMEHRAARHSRTTVA